MQRLWILLAVIDCHYDGVDVLNQDSTFNLSRLLVDLLYVRYLILEI